MQGLLSADDTYLTITSDMHENHIHILAACLLNTSIFVPFVSYKITN